MTREQSEFDLSIGESELVYDSIFTKNSFSLTKDISSYQPLGGIPELTKYLENKYDFYPLKK